LRRYTFLEGKADPPISMPKWRLAGEGGSANFWCQNGALLWRADPSFRNSVTGSGCLAKCSNILQDSQNGALPDHSRCLLLAKPKILNWAKCVRYTNTPADYSKQFQSRSLWCSTPVSSMLNLKILNLLNSQILNLDRSV
jgi:hypothetical protein